MPTCKYCEVELTSENKSEMADELCKNCEWDDDSGDEDDFEYDDSEYEG